MRARVPGKNLEVSEIVRAVLARNLQSIRKRIDDACNRAGRDPREVTLVAVTKYVDVPVIRELIALGQNDLGESRPQSLSEKAAAVSDPVRWHFIGSLQTNKVRRTLEHASLIHSVDRMALAEAIQTECEKSDRRVSVSLEVNISGESNKHGFSPHELMKEYEALRRFPALEIVGLMGMAAENEDPELARPAFRSLRRTRDELRELWPAGPTLPMLSMGMSGDFEIAVEEGATHVRVGSALYVGIPETEAAP
jgi:pyridoxal phosphate enzyme (YggS family)